MVRRQPFLKGRWQQQLLLGFVGPEGLAQRCLSPLKIPAIILHNQCFSDGLLDAKRNSRACHW